MATATKAKRGRRKAVGGRRKAGENLASQPVTPSPPHPVTPSPPRIETVQAGDLNVKHIDPSPFQPRGAFPAEEIEALAASIWREGLLQPIAVRRKPIAKHARITGGRYELLDGERRLRAYKLLGLKTIRSEVQERTDAEARAIVLTSALQRKDLNPIEQARALQTMLAAGDAKGPTELAELVGLSQGQVSNLLRLLGLPKEWQGRIISGEIPQSQARLLVAYAKRPKVLAAIDKELSESYRQPKKGNGCSLDEFTDIVGYSIRMMSEPLGGKRWEGRVGRTVAIFKPTDQQREQLGIIKDPDGEERATHTKLWKELQAAHVKGLLKRQRKQDGDGKAKGSKGKTPAKKLTAAQQKQLAAEERQRAKERERKLRDAAWKFNIDWNRVLISRILRGGEVSVEVLLRLLLYFVTSKETWQCGSDFAKRGDALERLLKARKIKVPRRERWQTPNLMAPLAELPNQEALHNLAAEYLADVFWCQKGGPASVLPDEDVLAIAGDLGVDRQAAWKKEQAGELSARYWELHNKETLVALCKELKATIKTIGPASKEDLVKCLHKPGVVRKMPKELVKVKRVRG